MRGYVHNTAAGLQSAIETTDSNGKGVNVARDAGNLGDSDKAQRSLSELTTRRLSRRRVLWSGAGAVTGGVFLSELGGKQPSASAAIRQDGADSAASPAATPESSAGTPEAGAATPVATPATTSLQILRAPYPVDPGPATTGGEINVVIGTTLSNLNPVSAAIDPQVGLSYLDGLLTTDPETMKPVPSLARGWDWNEDGTEITLTLRGNVEWHDGSPLTPEDVRFSFLVYREDTSSGYARFFDLLREIEIIGQRRLRIRFAAPDGGWLANAGTLPIFQGAQYQEYWSSQPSGSRSLDGFDWEASPPIGTGPWKVAAWRARRLELEANPAYWRDPPHLDRLVLSSFEDPVARVERWRGGEADIVWSVPPDLVESLEGEDGRLYVCDSARVLFAAFNFQNPVSDPPGSPGLFSDIRLRTALSVAIDREKYADRVFHGFIQHDLAGTIVQPWLADPSLENPPHNPSAARALLDSGGYIDRDGDGIRESPGGIPLQLTVIAPADGPAGLEATLSSVAEDFTEVGVELRLEVLDPPAFNERWQVTRDFDLVAFGYRLYPGFTDFDLYGSDWDIRTNLQGWNPGAYANAEVDSLIARILTTTDLDAQPDLLRDLQGLVNDDLFGLWFGSPQDLVLVAPRVRGFSPAIEWQTRDLETVWVDEQ